MKPKLTAYVSKKKVITVKFPWESIGGLLLKLMCVREFPEELNMTVEDVEFKTVEFLDHPLSSFFLRFLSYSHPMIKMFRLISPEKIGK